ncbi:drug/metabolite transporter [Nitzschia inconspicua]|uniref:Drug/metabolite transporter n=1 Tax=Nitzschia inconspicua TaxID=303405 RepID=A0A9K3LZ87_9STRA|nr:drug/metabolite transporter [Nitzschia inconspicua]
MANNGNDTNDGDGNDRLSTAPPREPDELDALLERTGGGLNTEEVTADGSNAAVYYQSIDNATTDEGMIRGHRKSYTAGNLLERTGDRFRGLFGNRKARGNAAISHRSHRKNKSSLSDLFHDAMRSVDLEPLKEDFLQTASSVRHIWRQELEEMEQGSGSGFFDMTATRSFAVLPDDLPNLGTEARLFSSPLRRLQRVEEALPSDEEAAVEEEVIKPAADGTALITNVVLLLGAVFAHSSNSTAVHMLNGVSPTMKLYWRMSASYLILLPFSIVYLKREGLPQLSVSGWTTFVSASLFYSLSTLCFYTALEYTTIGNAVIYANSQALLLIVGKVFTGEGIHALEGVGVVVAFSGAILCSRDSEESSEEADLTNALFGDLLALCSAAFGVAYLTVAKAVRSQMSVIFFMTTVMILGSIIVLIYLIINPHEEISFDMNPFHGIFGGFDLSHHRLEVMAYLAIVVNFGGSMGFIRAMQHFDTIVIAVATLMEPLAASFIAFLCHAGLLPGPLGWLGNCLVVLGTLCVVYPSMGKSDAGMH